MSNFGERLDKHLKDSGISQADLARLSGVKQQTISYIIRSRANSSAYATRLAKALAVNPYWLQDGTGSPFDQHVDVGSDGVSATKAHWVPKIQMDEVPQYLEHGAEGAEKAVTSVNPGPHAFAVEVAGRSMEPHFSNGDELIVDPAIKPEPGDFVIARADDAMVLRKWRPLGRGTGYELIASNPDFPVMKFEGGGGMVLAVVVEHRRRLRR